MREQAHESGAGYSGGDYPFLDSLGTTHQGTVCVAVDALPPEIRYQERQHGLSKTENVLPAITEVRIHLSLDTLM